MCVSKITSPIVLAFVALLFFPLLACQPAWAAEGGFATGESADISAQTGGTNYHFGADVYYGTYEIEVEGVTSGSVSFDESTRTLTLDNARMDGVYLCGSGRLTVKLVGNSIGSEYLLDERTYIKGEHNVTVVGPGSATGDIFVEGNLTIEGGALIGTVSCDGSFTMYGGSVTKNVTGKAVRAGGNVSMSGGSVTKNGEGTAVSANGNFSMSSGSVAKSGEGTAVSCDGSFSMSGGSISATDSCAVSAGSYGGSSSSGYQTYTAKVSGGEIVSTSPSGAGLYFDDTDLIVTGGVVSVTNSYGNAISLDSSTYRGVTYGGSVILTGGSVTATVRNPSSHSAIRARSVSNRLSCLKSIKGSLSNGASFKVAGNEYRALSDRGVILTKYGSKSKKLKLSQIKFGGVKYSVRGVGTKAFSTKAGAKVKSITFDNLYILEANALLGTKSLVNLKLTSPNLTTKYNSKGRVKSVKWRTDEGYSINKKAFKNCGKAKGAQLTVTIWNQGVYKADAAKYRKLFTSKGMSKKFKLKTYQ